MAQDIAQLITTGRGFLGSMAYSADECADVLICLDKLARRLDVDLEAVTITKFNVTSDKVGLPHRLEAGDRHPGWTEAGHQWLDAGCQAFTATKPAASQEVYCVPDRFMLSERELDDECGCPEEIWDTPFGVLNMHLTAGKPSNACLDNGDEGEWSIDLTRATVTEARSAFFAWSMIAASLPAATAADKLRQAREEAYRAGYTHVLGLTQTGVPTSSFERDVGAYMADFVRRRA